MLIKPPTAAPQLIGVKLDPENPAHYQALTGLPHPDSAEAAVANSALFDRTSALIESDHGARMFFLSRRVPQAIALTMGEPSLGILKRAIEIERLEIFASADPADEAGRQAALELCDCVVAASELINPVLAKWRGVLFSEGESPAPEAAIFSMN